MNLLLADVVSWASKPSRCLYYITPVIPNRHFIPPHLFCFQSPTHNLPQLAAVSKRHYHPATEVRRYRALLTSSGATPALK